ncbi:MAG: hypothetical protein D6797_02270 [Bdellovibrio sp.]|nr:MAG: hypothetical protein D6797_02270 [Bdellovibrio sp.]
MTKKYLFLIVFLLSFSLIVGCKPYKNSSVEQDFAPGITNQMKADHLLLISGNNQSASILQPLSSSLQVKVLDENNEPVSGIQILFSPNNGGSANPAVATTNSQGLASTTWTLGSSLGAQTLTVSRKDQPLPGSPATLTFTATALPGAPDPSTSSITGVNNVTADGTSTSTITITLRDSLNNGVPNVTPTFSATGSSNTYGACSTTDANGISTCTLSSTVAETKVLSITSPISKTGSSITFVHGPASQLVFTTQPGGGTAGTAWAQQPVVEIQDAHGNLVTTGVDANQTLTFTLSTGTGSLMGTTSKQAVAGVVDCSSCGLNIDLAGSNKVLTVTKPDTTGSGGTPSLSQNSNSFTISAGSPHPSQSSISIAPEIGSDMTPFTVTFTIKDQYGNPVSGVTPNFSVSGGSYNFANQPSTPTDANGQTTGTLMVMDGGLKTLTITSPSSLNTVSTTTNAIYTVDISNSRFHTCAVLSNGKVKCWGSNFYGQLGNGTKIDSATPVEVLGITNAIKVATGREHSCALLSDQTIKCWGNGASGRLGNGSTASQTTPVTVSGISTAIDIDADGNGSHTCALLANTDVYCWGNGWAGKLGNGSNNSSSVPIFSGITSAQSIALGDNHTCASLTDGTVKCMGYNSRGQVGNNTLTTYIYAPALVQVPTSAPNLNNNTHSGTTTNLTNVAKVSAGASSTCALLNDGTAKCWGNNGYSMLADSTNIYKAYAVDVLNTTGSAPMTNIASISPGANHNCLTDTSGQVFCLGMNSVGQMGNYTTKNNSGYPTQITSLSNVASVSVGYQSNCSLPLSKMGLIYCWGSNEFGQLGYTSNSKSTPTDITGLGSGILSLTTGPYHGCAVLSDGTAKCAGWGGRRLGLGNNTWKSKVIPQTVVNLSNAIDIQLGFNHSCALLSNGDVMCWGNNGSYGTLGDGTTNHQTSAVLLPGIHNVIQIAAGYYHNCAVKSDKTLWCWGRNTYGQLGLGDTTHRLSPTQVLTNVEQVVTGQDFTCARLTSGNVQCWGRNNYWQTGNTASTANVLSPFNTGVNSAIYIAASSTTACAVLNTGSITCWGYNGFGNMGNGTSGSKNAPTSVSGITTATQIVGTYGAMCALLSDGSVQCWGRNYSKELGQIDILLSKTPLTVPGISGPQKLLSSSNGNSFCAYFSNNSVKCWGANESSQLLLGDNDNSIQLLSNLY